MGQESAILSVLRRIAWSEARRYVSNYADCGSRSIPEEQHRTHPSCLVGRGIGYGNFSGPSRRFFLCPACYPCFRFDGARDAREWACHSQKHQVASLCRGCDWSSGHVPRWRNRGPNPSIAGFAIAGYSLASRGPRPCVGVVCHPGSRSSCSANDDFRGFDDRRHVADRWTSRIAWCRSFC